MIVTISKRGLLNGLSASFPRPERQYATMRCSLIPSAIRSGVILPWKRLPGALKCS